MKKVLYTCILAAVTFSACQNNEIDCPVTESRIILTAVIDDGFSDGTKTSLDEYGNVLWKKGDQISAFLASTINQQYQVTDASDGKTSASLNAVSSSLVAGTEISNNVAFYPYASTASIAKNGDAYVISDITLPATQTYAANSFGNGAFPMAAVTSSTTDNNLKFKNVLGGLKLQLTGTATIASISVTGNNDEILCGTATVTSSNGSTPSINLTDASAKTVTLNCDSVALDETTPTSFIIAIPPMTMTGGFTVTVTDTEGKQMEIKTTKSQTIARSSILKMPEVTYVGTGIVPEGCVDLGLSVYWATCNLGAANPEESGNFYAWGETSPKSTYSWATYGYCSGTYNTITKYSTIGTDNVVLGNEGYVDGKKILDPEDDAATTSLGGKWRMPTRWEIAELMNNTTKTRTKVNGVYGYKLQSKKSGFTDNYIFIPAAGYMNGATLYTESSDHQYTYYARCWSKDLDDNGSLSCQFAYYLDFEYYGYDSYIRWSSSSATSRYCGFSIRPVYAEDDNGGITGITLIKAATSVYVGMSESLSATVSRKSNAVNNTVEWTSSDPSIVTVNCNGTITAVAEGTATITAKTVFGGFSAACTVTVTSSASIPTAVDLGLSVLWASKNLGATTPDGYGDYYAWGNSSTSSSYNWANYPYNKGSEYNVKLNKYCSNSTYGYNNYTDTKTVLESTDDAASVNLSGGWRMPTSDEMLELISDCIWTSATYNGIVGFKVQSKNASDKWIFIPKAGRYSDTGKISSSFYWTSSLYTDDPKSAYYLSLSDYSVPKVVDGSRYYGCTIRPVM